MENNLNKMTNASTSGFTFCCCILLRHLPVVLACYHANSGGVLVRYVTDLISKWLTYCHSRSSCSMGSGCLTTSLHRINLPGDVTALFSGIGMSNSQFWKCNDRSCIWGCNMGFAWNSGKQMELIYNMEMTGYNSITSNVLNNICTTRCCISSYWYYQ